ncbi:hypothetical protein [Gracilibacillus xinjiangensis]|uniref:Uncharacterized protein n=1 Tax=Gracilibacillus xinjiangensis TaxID=1193282 RepID=A0ABV8WP75_9BACI
MDNPQYMLPLRLECTLYFENNPYAYETVNGLSMRLGRNPSDLVTILQQLVSLNILEIIGEGDFAIYHYKQPNFISEADLTWEKV